MDKKEQPVPKFMIDDLVKPKGDKDRDAGRILRYAYDPAKGFTYVISSKDVDVQEKKVVKGVKICAEKELTLVSEEKEDQNEDNKD